MQAVEETHQRPRGVLKTPPLRCLRAGSDGGRAGAAGQVTGTPGKGGPGITVALQTSYLHRLDRAWGRRASTAVLVRYLR